MRRASTTTGTRAAGLVLAAAVVVACDVDRGADLGSEERGRMTAGAEAAVASFFAASNDLDTDGLLAHYHQGPELVQVACTTVRRGFNAWSQ